MPRRWSTTILIILSGIALLIWSRVIYASPVGSGKPEVVVDVLDIGQGDAIFIKLPNGDQALVDGGPNDAVLNEIGRRMPPFDRKIEHIVLTHPHADHLAGLVKVIERYDVGEIIETDVGYSSATFKRWQDDVKSKNVPVRLARQGQTYDWGSGAQFEVLWPDKSFSGVEDNATDGAAMNDTSVIGRLRFGETGFMLTGDAEEGPQTALCDSINAEKLKSQVLKIAHHGSSGGTAECFLQKVAPKTAVISAGKDNKYHHPHAETLELLARFAIEVLRTDQRGTLEFVSDGSIVKRR
ncbi:MAG TPA: MBL fold metallo-hydrolase [Patescibacteria group bacterium]|nr:MBL fold metallo-hydrolase [Patescibacteria group bacterium]